MLLGTIRTNQRLQMTLGSTLCKKSADCTKSLTRAMSRMIRAVLDDSDVNSDSTIPQTRIEAFELLAEDDVRVLIANSRSTSCSLDPIPTHLLKSCSESLIPVITNIIKSSLESGIFRDCWK